MKFSDIDKLIDEDKKTMEIMPTGIHLLDATLEGGFLKKDLVLLCGKTGGGKSLLAGNIFYNMAKQGKKCAYFSLEISNQMVASRLMGARANISPTRLMIHTLEESEQKRKNEAKADISVYEEFMYFYDDLYTFPNIAKVVKEEKFDFAVVDFLQNIDGGRSEEYEKLSAVAIAFQRLAKAQNCCILVLSQLSNLMAKDKKNTDIVEYKGSGAIGHAADLGFFIEEGRAGDGSLSLRLRKNRRGVSGTSISFMIKQPGGQVVEL
jgi:replicative DNA helicase